jgi:hypothetical protein
MKERQVTCNSSDEIVSQCCEIAVYLLGEINPNRYLKGQRNFQQRNISTSLPEEVLWDHCAQRNGEECNGIEESERSQVNLNRRASKTKAETT